ncbi:dipeptidase [Streptomyces showdoensis]|uniref:Beta-Ala-His dipeptidase n=1 Tax=Streptomyces showdoensis TaxID=68268 RepID=A0A2P2GCP1_STREW|nr:dipeptidase [Streptomyces showdoensis]KKZ69222.1 beta-Ala-His dipeptidase [Streptomyces showdoensis]
MTADSPETAALRAKVRALMPRAKEDLAALVAMRSVADPRQFPPEECARAADFLVTAFTEAGLRDMRRVTTPDGTDAVVGHAPGPEGAPTVLLYCHYDVQPPLDDDAWRTPPFELTEREGRWYGRGTADCKGNIAMHLTALRALGGPDGEGFPVHLKFVAEGSEEQGTGGLEQLVPQRPELFAADALLVCDTGNFALGLPTATTSLRGLANVVVTVSTLRGEMHSGMFGGPAPDALAALVRILDSLCDEAGNTTVKGLAADGSWAGVDYPVEQFRADVGALDGVSLLGTGTVAEELWARPAVTVLGIDCPPVVGSSAAVQAKVRARVSLRVPPGVDAEEARSALTAHLLAAAPWGARVEVEPESVGQPFEARTDGPAYRALGSALSRAYGKDMVRAGQGGSIPLCNVLSGQFPEAEIALIGVEEPGCLIHAPNESVDPAEIETMALAEALFLRTYANPD